VIRQYRHGAKSIFTELPCGGIEQGEPPERAAARELLEETGCVADTLKALPVMSPNPARYSNRIHTFIASGTRHVQQQQLDARRTLSRIPPLPQVLSLIDSGSFSQALHVSGLFLALRGRGLIPTSIPLGRKLQRLLIAWNLGSPRNGSKNGSTFILSTPGSRF